MGIKRKVIVTLIDDFDGNEIEMPEDEMPEPIEMVYKGQGYKLYMSDANAKKLDTYLAKILKDAETFVPGRTVVAGGGAGFGQKPEIQQTVEAAGHTSADVKRWAAEQGTYKTGKGEPLTEASRGRLAEQIWADFAKANDIA